MKIKYNIKFMNNADYFDVFNSLKGRGQEINIFLKAFKGKSKLSRHAARL